MRHNLARTGAGCGMVSSGRRVVKSVTRSAWTRVGCWAVVAVPVALGCRFQADQVLGHVGGEGLVDVGPGGG
nr:hypothetical protein OH837_00600 [Streptomyces canus]